MTLLEINFRLAAGRTSQNFKDCYEEYAVQNFREFYSNKNITGHIFLIPPIFSYHFTQPAFLQSYPIPSGALPQLKEGTRQNLIGAMAEHRIYEVLEQYYTASGKNVLILHGFKVDDLKLSRLQRIFPGLNLEKFETDFIIFYDDGTVINVEVKGEDEKEPKNPTKANARKFADSKKQLKATEKFLMTLATYFDIIYNLSTNKFVVMPDVEYQPAKPEKNIQLFSGKTWRADLQQRLDSTRSTGTIPSHKESIKELVKIVCAIKVLEVVTHEGKEWASISKTFKLSVVALEESKKVQEHKIIENLESKLESKMQRTSQVVLQQHEEATEKKVTLLDILKVYFLTPEQMAVWQEANKRQILVGVAGTGKTLLLLGRAVLQLESGEKIIFIGTDSMQNKLKNHFAEHSKHSANMLMLSPYGFLTLPEVQPLAEISRNIYNNLYRFIEDRLNAQYKRINFFKQMDNANQMKEVSSVNWENEDERVAKCLKDLTDYLADTFRELAEDEPDLAHSISYLTGRRGEVLAHFINFFHLDLSELHRKSKIVADFFTDKNIIIDDLLCLSSDSAIAECGFFWLFIAFLLPHCCDPNKYCWIAIDYMQMLVHKNLATCICKGVDAAFDLIWIIRLLALSEEQLQDTTRILKERAVLYDTLLNESLVQIAALFDAPTVFEKQYFSTNLLGTVMRCTGKVFGMWKTTYESALSETSLDGTMLAASKLCTGHRFIGVEPRCLSANGAAESLKIIKDILEKDVTGSCRVLSPSDVAILVMENESSHDTLFHYLQLELAAWLEKSDFVVCEMADQPLRSNAIALGKASESASQEWTVVIVVTDIIHSKAAEIQKYLGLSRCIEWLNLIQIAGPNTTST